jgi:hypothetical protein
MVWVSRMAVNYRPEPQSAIDREVSFNVRLCPRTLSAVISNELSAEQIVQD